MDNVINLSNLKPSKEYESVETATARRKEVSAFTLRKIIEFELSHINEKSSYYLVEGMFDTYVEMNSLTDADEGAAKAHLTMLKDFVFYPSLARKATGTEYRGH